MRCNSLIQRSHERVIRAIRYQLSHERVIRAIRYQLEPLATVSHGGASINLPCLREAIRQLHMPSLQHALLLSACYRSHSLRCTESFMRDNVLSDMKTIHVSSQAKHKMLQTLQRSHEQDLISTESYNADDDDGREERSILSEETLQKLSEGKNITLQGLSNEERKAFLQAVKSGKVSI
ncbi:hypothetical protein O6H91_Y302400 [Diphasiastrum complanatum]|nr:hypothetical protein O6H91_Y302400 [Diphasiastrum complanatum]